MDEGEKMKRDGLLGWGDLGELRNGWMDGWMKVCTWGWKYSDFGLRVGR